MADHIHTDPDRELFIIDEHPDVWCPACSYAAAVRYDLAIADRRTLEVVGRIVIVVCRGCDRQWPLPLANY